MTDTAPLQPALGFRQRIEEIALLALLLVLLWLLFDWNWLKGPIERHVEHVTGRPFVIEGDLRGRVGHELRLHADAVRLANADWAGAQPMLVARDLDVTFEWLPLLRRELVIPTLRASHLDLALERGADHRANWEFANARFDRAPKVGSARLGDGTLVVHDEPLRTDIRVEVRTLPAAAPNEPPPFSIAGGGTYRGAPFKVEGSVESPLALRDTKLPYHVDLRMRAADTHAHARGELIDPLQFAGFDVQFAIAGPNLARLYPLLGLALPDTPPFALDGRLSHEKALWIYRDFRGKVGDSDLAGDAQVDLAGPRPKLIATLASQRLDLDDLAGFVGAPPGAGPGETATAEQQRAAAARKARPQVLPNERYDVAKLHAMDADVKLRARHVQATWPFEDMTAHLMLDDGYVRLDPLAFGIAHGTASGRIELNARRQPIAAVAQIRARNLELPTLLERLPRQLGTAGRVGANIDLSGSGDSVAAILGHSSGSLGVIMGEGRISNLVMELAGIDVYESLKFMLTKDRIIPIRCAYADFVVDDGRMNAKALVFDTTDTLITGDGSMSLRDETLDLKLRAQPKDFSPLAFRAPLKLTGTFKQPHFGPEKGPITMRAVASAVLYSLAPPAALAALFDKGNGKDADCSVEFRKR